MGIEVAATMTGKALASVSAITVASRKLMNWSWSKVRPS